MTADDIQTRLDEACRTLLRLHIPGRWPAEHTRSQWPWAVQAYWDNFAAMVGGKSPAGAAKEVARMLRSVALDAEPPTAGEKARMEEAFAWFPLLRDEIQRRTLWQTSMLRVRGISRPYAAIQNTTGVPRATIRARYCRALAEIAEALDGLQDAKAA